MNIEAMAREAGLRTYQEQAPGIDGAVGDWSALERFAALVRAQAMKDAAEEVLNASTKPWGYVETSGDLREALAYAIRAIAAKPIQTPP